MDNELKNFKDKNIERLNMLIVDKQNHSNQIETNKIKLKIDKINHNLLKVKNDVQKLEKKLKKYKANDIFKL